MGKGGRGVVDTVGWGGVRVASKLAAGTEQPTSPQSPTLLEPTWPVDPSQISCSALSPAAFEEESGVSGSLLETCHVLRAHSRAAAATAVAVAACDPSGTHHLLYPPAKERFSI